MQQCILLQSIELIKWFLEVKNEMTKIKATKEAEKVSL
jgi:hypothetical protein